MKSSQGEVMRRQKQYRRGHPWCWRPVIVNGVWRLCSMPTMHAHHIAGRGTRKEDQNNKFPLCSYPRGSCHNGWAHGAARNVEHPKVRRLRMFAVKLMIGETSLPEIKHILFGMAWMPDGLTELSSIEEFIIHYAEEMETLKASFTFLRERRRSSEWMSSISQSLTGEQHV